METLEEIVAANLTDLRKNARLTQAELAEKINYSDKSVSKWERGESLPDLKVLVQLADLFDVTVDYFVTKDAGKRQESSDDSPQRHETRYRVCVEIFAACAVWIAATAIFFSTAVYSKGVWMAFVWAIPASMLVLALFSLRWRYMICATVFQSIFCWSLLAAIYLQLLVSLSCNVWTIFFIGIPLQGAVILWRLIRRSRNET